MIKERLNTVISQTRKRALILQAVSNKMLTLNNQSLTISLYNWSRDVDYRMETKVNIKLVFPKHSFLLYTDLDIYP